MRVRTKTDLKTDIFVVFGSVRFVTRLVATGGHSGAVPPKFVGKPKFCCSQKIFYSTYNKNKNIAYLKMCLAPPKMKPGSGPVSDHGAMKVT